MEWFHFALIAGIAWGIVSGFTKKLLEKHSVIEFSFIIHFIALIVYTPYFLYLSSIHDLALLGVIFAIVSGIFNIAGVYLYNDSIKIGKLSEEIPLTRTTPVFTAVLGFVILGESMDILKGTGILLVTFGSVLIMKDSETSILTSIKGLMGRKPAIIAILSALVYSFAAIIDRTGTQILAPELYTFFIYLTLATAFLMLNLGNGNNLTNIYTKFTSNRNVYVLASLLTLIGSFSIFQAFSRAEASLVIPLLQIQVLIAIIIGREYFHEENILMKIIGSLVLIVGIILLV